MTPQDNIFNLMLTASALLITLKQTFNKMCNLATDGHFGMLLYLLFSNPIPLVKT